MNLPKAIVVATISLLAAGSLDAQTISPPARTQNLSLIDPTRILAAKEMLSASRVVRNARVGAALGFEAGLASSLEKSGISDDEELVATIRKVGMDEMSNILDKIVPQMVDDLAQSYSQRMTVDEMQAATAFYRSSAGQKLLDLMPDLASETTENMRERLKPYLPGIEEAVKQAVLDVMAKRPKTVAPL